MRREYYVMEWTQCQTCKGAGEVYVKDELRTLKCGECGARGCSVREVTLRDALIALGLPVPLLPKSE